MITPKNIQMIMQQEDKGDNAANCQKAKPICYNLNAHILVQRLFWSK